jgi:phage-related protein (TIGR01555 family)
MSNSNGSPLQATTTRLDDVQALINLATGQGTGRYDPSQSAQIGLNGAGYLDQNSQAFYRRSHKILRKLIETIPNQMTFRWGAITLGGEDGDPKVKDAVDQWTKNLTTRTVYNRYTGLPAAFNAAQIAANETGNAALIILADDGLDIDEPLEPTKIKDIKGLYLADRWAIKPYVQGLNTVSLEGGITHYTLTQQRAINQLKLVASNGKPLDAGNIKVHRSRVLWFRGEELSDYSLQQNSGCDDSVLEGVVQSFKEYHAGLRGAGRMLVDFDFFVHKIEGYLEKMMGDGSKEYQKKMDDRLQANSLMRSAYRGMAIDKDKEEIDTVSRSVAGYSDLLEQVLSSFLSNTDLQPSELLQKYPAGLANTGKTEQQNCNDRTRLYQSKKFDSNVRDFYSIIFNWKSGPTKGIEPKVWDWEWHELYPTTPLEQSELELNWAQIDANRIQSGVYSPDDAAKSHYSTPEFNPHITIDFKERERLKKEQEQQALEAAQQQGALPPGQEDPTADPLAGLTFDAADPLIAPKQVMDAAKKGLQIRRQLDSGAIPARVALLARKLDAGQHLSTMDVQNIQFYHQRNRPPAKLDANAETALYLLHGGPAGKAWADRAMMPKADEREDGINPAVAIGAGVVGAAALGAGAFLFSKGLESKGKGKPCGKGHISAQKECHVGIEGNTASPLSPTDLVSEQNKQIVSFALSSPVEPLTPDDEANVSNYLDYQRGAEKKRTNYVVGQIQKGSSKITEAEAKGLASYLGDEAFSMNKALYDEGGLSQDAQLKSLNKAAINALRKLPPIDQSSMDKVPGGFDHGVLMNHAKITDPSVLSRIYQTYTEAAASKQEIYLEKFLSTTHNPLGIRTFRQGANLEIRVNPRLDGKGSGRLVDQFKVSVVEDEVLYPVGARMKVLRTEKRGTLHRIVLEEV